MKTRSVGLVLIAALLTLALGGCGARTGLTSDEESDDADLGPAPDVFGTFPCTFSPVGEAVPIYHGPRSSSGPSMEFGGGHLGIRYRQSLLDGDQFNYMTTFCLAIPYDDGGCAPIFEEPGEHVPYALPLAWNDGTWARCSTNVLSWTDRDTLGAGGTIIGPRTGRCSDLVASGMGYITTMIDTSSSPMGVTIMRLDAVGVPADTPLHEHVLDGVLTQLAADDGMEIAAWSSSSWLVIRRLDGDGPHLEVMVEADGEVEHIAIALRRPITGVLWSERRGGLRNIFFRLVDMERGQMTTPVELGIVENVVGLDVVAVNEGFVTAWSDFSDTGFDQVIAIPISVDGWDTHLYSVITLHHELHDPLFGEYGGPSLAYDNRAVFVTFTRQVPSTGLYQAHFQQLDCHR